MAGAAGSGGGRARRQRRILEPGAAGDLRQLPAACGARTAGEYVQTHLLELPAENKIILNFDDWHFGEWSMSVQVTATTRDEALGTAVAEV